MFESKTYDALMSEVLSSAPEDIDTRQGSIFYDAVSGVVLKIAELYTNLDMISDLTRLSTAEGEYLDIKADEYGIKRHSATKAQYYAVFSGTAPLSGERFFANGLYFTLVINDSNEKYFEAEEGGTAYNGIPSGTPAIPMNNLEGLDSAVFGSVRSYADDAESDASLRLRIYDKISGIGESGNKQHYKEWCESVDGVVKARIFPLWNGGNTVKAALIGSEGLPCSQSVVEAAQEFVDPADNGGSTTVDGVTYVVGDGLGNGAAPIGAHFTAAPALKTLLNVVVYCHAEDVTDIAAAELRMAEVLGDYCKDIALSGDETSGGIVRHNDIIVAITTEVREITDFSSLTINGSTDNIIIPPENVPVIATAAIEIIT